jgi:hypothetical protein
MGVDALGTRAAMRAGRSQELDDVSLIVDDHDTTRGATGGPSEEPTRCSRPNGAIASTRPHTVGHDRCSG